MKPNDIFKAINERWLVYVIENDETVKKHPDRVGKATVDIDSKIMDVEDVYETEAEAENILEPIRRRKEAVKLLSGGYELDGIDGVMHFIEEGRIPGVVYKP